MGGYVLAYVLASVGPISRAPVGPAWPVVAMTAAFFLVAGYHSGWRVFGGRKKRPRRSPSAADQ